MSDIVFAHLMRRRRRGHPNSLDMIDYLAAEGLKQLCRKVNRDFKRIHVWKNGTPVGSVSSPAIAERTADGQALSSTQSPYWHQMTLDDLIECDARLEKQERGIGLLRVVLRKAIEELRAYPVGTTIGEYCAAAKLNPYEVELLDVAFGGL